MTPAAPIATWRKVCEENFSRLIEDLEQQVESEVETRVSAVIDAAVQGAVSNATVESRRALAEVLNQANLTAHVRVYGGAGLAELLHDTAAVRGHADAIIGLAGQHSP